MTILLIIITYYLIRKPETRCSHVSTKFKSTCHQVYNYHRLLTWDQFSGLTMDIFKVLVIVIIVLKLLIYTELNMSMIP